MKSFLLTALAALPFLAFSCATPPPVRQAYYNTDPSALVIKSLASGQSQMVQPAATVPENNDLVLDKARTLAEHRTAIVILEGYTEPRPDAQFRDRGIAWFTYLRGLGYAHVVFLQGDGAATDGLPLVARYD